MTVKIVDQKHLLRKVDFFCYKKTAYPVNDEKIYVRESVLQSVIDYPLGAELRLFTRWRWSRFESLPTSKRRTGEA